MKSTEFSFLDLLDTIIDNRGKTCPVIKDTSGIPLIATNCIVNSNLYPVYEKVRYVSTETYENWFRGHPEPGDIIFVCKGSPGRVCWVPNPIDFCIAQDMVAIRPDASKVYPKYLFALLRSKKVQAQILNMHVGTLIPHFKKGDFGNLYLDIPDDYSYQKKVGDFYYKCSEKIDMNKKINQTLEEIVQAFFKSWFVDFDPVKAKVEGRRPVGMDDATADLFPDSLKESELGMIPKDWEVKTIGEMIQIVGGGTPSTKNPVFWEDGDIHWTTPKDFSKLNDKVLLNTARKITRSGLNKISSGLLPVNTVLMSSRAPVGYLAISKVPVAINQGFIGMKCTETLTPEFVLQWCNSIMEEIKQRAGGTTFAEISKKSFRDIKLIVPTKKIIDAYSVIANEIYTTISNNIKNSSSLSDTRDIIIPNLLSGELQIPEIE